MHTEDVQLEAEINKINFLLENLYALVLREAGATHADIPDLATDMVRQLGLPGTNYAGPANDTDRSDAARQLCSERVATFFSRVERRLRSQDR